MEIQASGTIEIESWDPEVFDERPGATLSRARVAKAFRGGLDGTSTAEVLLVADGGGNQAAYVAVERFTGELHGRKGSFVLHHSAPGSQGEPPAARVVTGAGTGELAGLSGSIELASDADGGHFYTLVGQLD